MQSHRIQSSDSFGLSCPLSPNISKKQASFKDEKVGPLEIRQTAVSRNSTKLVRKFKGENIEQYEEAALMCRKIMLTSDGNDLSPKRTRNNIHH